MAHPNPKYVFEVDLSNVNAFSFLNPDMHTESADLGRQNITQKATQHRCLIPGLTQGNLYEVMHGDTITEYGQKGAYLLTTYGPTSASPILKLVSQEDIN